MRRRPRGYACRSAKHILSEPEDAVAGLGQRGDLHQHDDLEVVVVDEPVDEPRGEPEQRAALDRGLVEPNLGRASAPRPRRRARGTPPSRPDGRGGCHRATRRALPSRTREAERSRRRQAATERSATASVVAPRVIDPTLAARKPERVGAHRRDRSDPDGAIVEIAVPRRAVLFVAVTHRLHIFATTA